MGDQQQGNRPKTSFERLEGMLEFRPGSNPSPTGAILSDIYKELKDDREKKAKEQARKTLTEAMDIYEKATAAKRQFDSNYAKMEKDLKKLLDGLERSLNGQPPPAEEQAEPGQGG